MSLPRSLATLVVALAILCAAPAAHAALRYQGKTWSDSGAVAHHRFVLFSTSDPQTMVGTDHCRSLVSWARCLAPTASVAVHFELDGQFEGSLGGGVCTVAGVGTPGAPLSGDYACANGDSGTFYFHRPR